MKKSLLVCLLGVVLCFVVVGCGKKDPIVGKWAYGSGDSFVFTFNQDKTCHYTANNKDCTYTIDGDKSLKAKKQIEHHLNQLSKLKVTS